MVKKIMKMSGYGWAIAGVPIILATFMGMDFWAEGLVKATGVKVSPIYSGGEIARSIEHNGYRTLVREPVFASLVGQSAEGFVQIDWQKAEGGQLPPRLEEDLDLDGDGRADCRVSLDTTVPKAAVLTPPPRFISLEKALPIKDGVIVRIRLHRQ